MLRGYLFTSEFSGEFDPTYISGWWFGTMEFYDFTYIGIVIIPTDELIFLRGVETTNQFHI
jgi:hypothetical protein